MTTQDLMAKKLDAEFSAAEARMNALEADARARQSKEQMDAITGVQERRERAREGLMALKAKAGTAVAYTRDSVQLAVEEFGEAIDRASERYLAWDDARSAHLDARIDQAQARLAAWKSMLKVARTEEEIRERDALIELEETIALAKARGAEWNRARHERKAAEAARDAARHFDEAYDAASKRFA